MKTQETDIPEFKLTFPCVPTPEGLVMVKTLWRVRSAHTPAGTDMVAGLLVADLEGVPYSSPSYQLFQRQPGDPSAKNWVPFPDFSRGGDWEYVEEWMATAASNAADEIEDHLLVEEMEPVIHKLREWADEAEHTWEHSAKLRANEEDGIRADVMRERARDDKMTGDSE